jgi:hypothetical protein
MSLPVPKRMKQSAAYHHSARQENRAAVRLGGTTTPGSGSKDVKGDVRVRGKLRVECKATSNKSFSFTRDMADAIESAGMTAGEYPAIEVEFLPIDKHAGGRWVILPHWMLDEFLQTLQNDA